MVTAASVREMNGHQVQVSLTFAGGGLVLKGRIVSCLESADGLVVYLVDEAGKSNTIHYQHIDKLVPLGSGPEA